MKRVPHCWRCSVLIARLSRWLCLLSLVLIARGAANDLDDYGEPGGTGPTDRSAPLAAPGQLLVRFKPAAVSPSVRSRVLETASAGIHRVHPVGRHPARARLMGAEAASVFDGLVRVELQDTNATEAVRARLARDPAVLYVEPNYILRTHDQPPRQSVLPNDFFLGRQWHLQNTGQGNGRPGADIKATEAWAYSTGSRAVTVAVIDTGIDYFHPDLEANIWVNPGEIPGNGEDDDGNGYVDDVYGFDFVSEDSDPMDDQVHGTHVAGIIGAVGNNRIGVSGVCWEVSLMALKAFNDRGEAMLSDVIEAIEYAIANGARILNASWGQTDQSRALAEAITAAHRAGLIIVASAGNANTDALAYPAAYPEPITVAALDAQDRRAIFSNFGWYVDLAAPGDLIFSTFHENRYDLLSGTSMAAPQVSGVAALVLARQPEFTNTEVETILRNSVDELRSDRPIGGGRINAGKAARIQTPLPSAFLKLPEVLFGRMDLPGTAAGERFASYRIEAGPGIYPTNWTTLHESSVPVEDGPLVPGFSTDRLPEGVNTLRLVVTDTLGQEASDRAVVTVRNVFIAEPRHNDVRRAGDVLAIRGNVFGQGRSFRIEHGVGWKPTSWSTQGISLAHGGGREVVDGPLGTWDTSGAAPDTFHCLRLTALKDGQPVGESRVFMVYLDSRLRPGWPIHLAVTGEYRTNDWRDVRVADLDGDGLGEILRVDPGDAAGRPARLLVLGLDGGLRWARELGVGPPFADIPVVGDVDGDGRLEVFASAGSDRKIHAFRHDGTPLPGRWPVALSSGYLGKTLADLDRDGQLELIAFAQDPDWQTGGLYVLNASGEVLRQWPLSFCRTTLDAPRQFAAVGDLDPAPGLEIAAVSSCNTLGVFGLGSDRPLWTNTVNGLLVSSPVVGDLDGDGHDEVVITAHDPKLPGQSGTSGGVYAFTRGGKLREGWPVLIEQSFESTPALADVNGDGRLEIAVIAWSDRQLHLLQHNGFQAPGWPVNATSETGIKSHPVMGDVDGDGWPEVVLASPGRLLLAVRDGNLGMVGGIRAWRSDGAPLDLNPHPELRALVMESTGGSTRFKFPPPTLTDLDGNGRLDVVAASIDDAAYFQDSTPTTRKGRYTLYAWELATPHAAASQPWPMFHRDPAQTGYVAPLDRTNQPPQLDALPDQIIPLGGAFLPVELDRYVRDEDHERDQLTWTVAGQVHLVATLTPARVLIVTPPPPPWQGEEVLVVTAHDPEGGTASAAVSFAVRADYVPPQPRDDVVAVEEDGEVEIPVLANDWHPLGLPLRLEWLSRPLNGRAEVVGPGVVRYRPSTDYFGPDSFTYMVADAEGGFAFGVVRITVMPVEDAPIPATDEIITLEDEPVDFDPLANDFDPDGDPLGLVDFGKPEHGTLTRLPDGWLRYTPPPDWFGLVEVGYRVTDGHTPPVPGLIKIMVKPVNDVPIAKNLEVVMNRNTERDIFFAGEDADGDALKYRLVQNPESGELWVYPQIATYFPRKGFVGTDSFRYVALDPYSESAPATVTIRVLDVNNPPKVEDVSVATRVDRPVRIGLVATDPDGDAIVFSVWTPPASGVVTGAGTNFLYSPRAGYVGRDEFRVRAADDQGGSAIATVFVKVTDQNTAPTALEQKLTARANTPTGLILQGRDEEGDPLTFRIVTPPEVGRLSGTPPELTYTPPLDYTGPDRFTFAANDGDLDSAPATVTIEVGWPNKPPRALDQHLELRPDVRTPLTLEVWDEDRDPLRCVILKGPVRGRLFGSGTNFVFVPRPGATGYDSFTYKAWDGRAYSAVARVTLDIRPPSPPAPPRFTDAPRVSDGAVALTLRVPPQRTVQIQVSADLVEWRVVQTVFTTSDSLSVTDTRESGERARFYRAVLLP
ncbi:MAG: tandem-95 repeat protein [Verrucomicrobia bacterium]|nr:tandem-95 repeat protein [Verrucomicrobiota bacterium]